MATALTAGRGYTLAQIFLHWTIAALVVWQLVFGESLPHADRLIARGGTPDATTAFLASSHVWAGFAILALVVIRLALRLRNRSPAGEPEPGLMPRLAATAHWLFYALLFLTPITGIANYYFGLPTGDIHELAKPAFIVLIAAHVGAALWHQFVSRDGVMRRMLVPAG